MLVLIGGLLVFSLLYYVSHMKKDDAAHITQDKKLANNKDSSQILSPDEGNMECSQSISKFVCSKCGSRPMTIKIEEKVEETTTYEIIEENNVESVSYESFLHFDNCCRVPFPEAGIDFIDRKVKNSEESLEREINEYDSDDNDILTYSESWTENWLFRKKGRGDSLKAVSMFVPNTNAKYRAMIGEQNVDEISDFSELSNESDGELEGEDDRRKIGNGMAKYIYDERSRVLLDRPSKVPEEYNIELEADDFELCLSNENNKVPLHGNCNSNSESDGLQDLPALPHVSLDNRNTNSPEAHSLRAAASYTTDDEKYAFKETFNLSSLHDGIVVANDNASNSDRSNRSYKAELFIETRDVNQNSLSDDKLSDIDFNLFSPPKPGTIADREHRKWQSAAPMPNNPYSQENLQRRLLEKKYVPKYSSVSSLLGIARINGLDNEKALDTRQLAIKDMNFETIDLPEKSNDSHANNPIKESKNEATCRDDVIVETKSPEKSNVNSGDTRAEELKSDGMHEDDTKNKSRKSKCSNSDAIRVTKKNATINEVDYSSSDSHEEKISLPSVRKLVEVFSKNQKDKETQEISKPKDSSSESELKRPKYKRVERTQQSPRPLHLHSLTARSLSKEFREGLR